MESKMWLMPGRGKVGLPVACPPAFGECVQPRDRGEGERSSRLIGNCEDNRGSDEYP